jgi:uncharacterized protein (DUF433 family)
VADLQSTALDAALEHFSRRQDVCGGQPVIRGTRVLLRTVLASLAEGAAVGDILADFPTLTEEDVAAVIAFAAASAVEDIPLPAPPPSFR